MTSQQLFGRRLIVLLLLAASVVGAQSVKGQPATPVARFSATTAALNPGAGETLRIDVLRWSTVEEAASLAAALREKGDQQWSAALERSPRVGYIWTGNESLGYAVRYAQRIAMPDGSERIVVATERQLGSWSGAPWKVAGAAATGYPFALIELRLGRRGEGEGKSSLAARVTADPDSKGISLEKYAEAPLVLKNVRRLDAPVPGTKRPA